jgi:hypothetical protein
LVTVDDLGELAVEEGILDVERDREDDADRGRFGNWTSSKSTPCS